MNGNEGHSKQYWRSLERLMDSEPVQRQLASEFPEGASAAPEGVDRRSMLKLMGASFALAGLASCRRPEEKILPYVTSPEGLIPGVPRNYASTMTFGTSSYGVLVESHEGRPTKIEGNELHPASRGTATGWMQAAILQLYDPDRARRILAKTAGGDSEALAFEERSWEDFAVFWKQRSTEWQDSGGQGLAILTEPSVSPTTARLMSELRRRYPQAKMTSYGSVNDSNIFDGIRLATGAALRPLHHVSRADVILCLDCDLLLTESDSLNHARGFSAGRQPDREGGMSRLYVAESTYSVTGANADHRIRLKSSQIAGFVGALAKELGVAVSSDGPVSLSSSLTAQMALLASDLRDAGSAALVAAGRGQPPEVHAAVYAINYFLGSIGHTVTLHPITDMEPSDTDGLAELVEEMRVGRITTLLMCGGNPAYDAPAELRFGGALDPVRDIIHLSQAFNESSQHAHWRLPQTHFLEAWGDARSADGTLSIVQPLIAPLFDGKSVDEILSFLLTGLWNRAYDLVRETWRERLQAEGAEFDLGWNRALHDGLLQNSAAGVESAPRPETQGWSLTAVSPEFEVVFKPDNKVFDGRFANNGWLQELPDPITKITWDNAVLVSPSTAARLGLENGRMLLLSSGEQELQAPVWIQPGQADDSLTLPLGYGRSHGGAIANGVGFNAFVLRAGRVDFSSDVSVQPLEAHHEFVQTQEHWVMEGRPLIREASLDEYRANPGFAKEIDEFEAAPLWEEPNTTEGYQWGMVIDLASCIGCSACVVACQSENNIPIVGRAQVAAGREMHWLRVDRYFSGDPSNARAAFQPVPCMQCENAPCEQVCPVAATVHDSEGLNAMVYNRCIGTRYCSNNCPYKVRRFNFFNFTKDTPELVKLGMNPNVTVRSRGVMEKCTYCVQRINEAKISAKVNDVPIEDGTIQTACQQTCPTEAISFGNLNDPNSRVSRLKQTQRNYTLLAELYNKPRTSYLAVIRNPNPDWKD